MMFGNGTAHVEQVEMTVPAPEPVDDADTAIFAQALEQLKLESGRAKPKVKAKKRFFFT
jgi:hypothetical protein